MMSQRVCQRILFLVVLVLVGDYRAALAQTDCTVALQDYRVALQSYEDGLFDPAIAGFAAYLQKCPEAAQTPQAHYFLAEILYKRQRFADAFGHARQVFADKRETALRPHALLLAAQCLRQLGQIEQAQVHLQQVLTSTSTGEVLAAALYWLGELAFQQQRYDEARTYYRRLTKEQQAGPYAAYAHYSLGWLYRQLGDASAALEAFSAFLTVAPQHELAPQARFARAALLRETGQLHAAALAFRQLAEEPTAGSQDEALFWWGETAYQLGQYAEAHTAYERLVQQYPQSTRHAAGLYGWGWTAVQQHACAAAIQPWEALLRQAPQFPQAVEVQHQLGVCYMERGQHEAARRHLQQVIAAGKNTAKRHDALLRLATLAFQQEEYAEAIAYYGRALPTAGPDDAFRLHYLLGETYAALGNQAQAIAQWQQVLAGPQTLSIRAQVLSRLADVYMSRQAWPQVIVFLRQLWDDFPEFTARTAVAAHLIRAYGELQQCAEALPFYDAIIKAAAETAQRQAALGAKAQCLFERGRYADVVAALAPLVARHAPALTTPQVLYTLGQAYIQLQQYHEAVLPLSLLRQRFPDHALTVAAETPFAVVLEKVGRREEALGIWKATLQRRSGLADEARARLQLHAGRLAFDTEHFAAALDFLAPVRVAPFSAIAAEAQFLSGEAYFRQQRWDLASQVYQGLLDKHVAEPHWSALARLRLGTVYEQQQEWERALHAYQNLLTTTADAALAANVRRRIAAIKAGRVLKPQAPSILPSEG